jgi:hypothetical protein
MARTTRLPKQLSGKCKTLLLSGVKQAGSYKPEEVMVFIEEMLTFREFNIVSAFLKWVVSNGREFGHGNVDNTYQEFRASQV